MVQAEELAERAILDSLERGRFYVSTGVMLDSINVTSHEISLEIQILDSRKYTTWFLGLEGRVLHTDFSDSPRYTRTGSQEETYIRVKVMDSNGKIALTQPVFSK